MGNNFWALFFVFCLGVPQRQFFVVATSVFPSSSSSSLERAEGDEQRPNSFHSSGCIASTVAAANRNDAFNLLEEQLNAGNTREATKVLDFIYVRHCHCRLDWLLASGRVLDSPVVLKAVFSHFCPTVQKFESAMEALILHDGNEDSIAFLIEQYWPRLGARDCEFTRLQMQKLLRFAVDRMKFAVVDGILSVFRETFGEDELVYFVNHRSPPCAFPLAHLLAFHDPANSVPMLHLLTEFGLNVIGFDARGRTALHLAAFVANKRYFKALLRIAGTIGAEIEFEGFNAFQWAFGCWQRSGLSRRHRGFLQQRIPEEGHCEVNMRTAWIPWSPEHHVRLLAWLRRRRSQQPVQNPLLVAFLER